MPYQSVAYVIRFTSIVLFSSFCTRAPIRSHFIAQLSLFLFFFFLSSWPFSMCWLIAVLLPDVNLNCLRSASDHASCCLNWPAADAEPPFSVTNMAGTSASGSEKGQGDEGSARQRTNPAASPNRVNHYELHLVDETYDESADPDFTLGNITTVSMSDFEIDDDDDDDGADDLEEEEDIIMDLQESDTDVDSNSTTATPTAEKAGTPIFKNTPEQNSSQSSITLPIHSKFRSFVHKNEIPRKVFHLSIGFVTLYLHCHGYKTANTWQPVSVAVSCIFLLDIIRFNWPYFNKLYCSTVGFLMREKEVNSVNGVIWFQLGSLITFMSHSQDVAVMAILLLSWSDTAASTVGRRFGHASPKLARGKSLVGSVAAFFTGIIACYVFYGAIAPRYPQYSQGFEYDPSTNMLNLHTLALLSGFIAAVSEGIDIAGLDDNLTIPVLSSFFLSGVIKLGKAN